MTCAAENELVEQKIDRVLTQYRESPNLLGLIRTYLGQAEEAIRETCPIPDAFDIDDASGDQLTIIGKWVGWPRYHCKGATQAVFGFEKVGCDPCGDDALVGGFCTSEWQGCPSSEFTGYTFVDDELYRRFLKARIIQLSGDYRRETLVSAIQSLFDSPGATLVRERPGLITVSLGRPFEPGERQIIDLYRDVLPVAIGIRIVIRSQAATGGVFGFGTGWGDFCTGQWVN